MRTCLLLLLMFPLIVAGQGPGNLIRQKEKQRQYLQQQIAALRVYLGYAKAGYKIVNGGVNTVKKIKDGDFNLHHDFISRLSGVNPKVKSYAKVAGIIAYQIRIIKEMKECVQGVREAGQFSEAELVHCTFVINNLLTSSLENIEALLVLVSDGKATLTDDERIRRIDVIYANMQDKYAFCSSFSEEMGMLTVHRMREVHEIDLSRKLNGLP